MIVYILLIIVLVVTMFAHFYIGSTFRKSKSIKSKYGKTGAAIAREILDKNSIGHVKIIKTDDLIADHYDSKKKIIRLSKYVYNNTSVAAIGIAAHECGHALQYESGYVVLKFRNVLASFFSLLSITGYILVLIGIFSGLEKLLWIGTLIECGILLFHIITLPLEFSASVMGVQQLLKYNIIKESEYKICRKMLRAAGLLYIAGVFSPIFEIYRLIIVAVKNN